MESPTPDNRTVSAKRGRTGRQRIAALVVASVLLAALVAWVGWSVWGPATKKGVSRAVTSSSTSAGGGAPAVGKAGSRDPSAPAPVDIQIALLSQYYEHGP